MDKAKPSASELRYPGTRLVLGRSIDGPLETGRYGPCRGALQIVYHLPVVLRHAPVPGLAAAVFALAVAGCVSVTRIHGPDGTDNWLEIDCHADQGQCY